MDIDSEDKEISVDQLIQLQRKKTGAFIESALVTPYYLFRKMTREESRRDKIAIRLNSLSFHIGLAFQIKDDILDVTSNCEILGKSTGKDARDSKATFVTLMGLELAERTLEAEIAEIKAYFAEFAEEGFDTTDFMTLTDYLYNRDR